MIAIFRFLCCFAMIVHVRSHDTVYLSIRVSIQKTMDPVIRQIRQDLKEMADPEIQKSSKRFFKEDICCYGIRTADVVSLAKKYWKEIKNKNKQEIFSLCEELYKSGYMEESFVVSQWAHSLSGRYEPEDLAVFKRWIDTYITNWASCDGLCNHTMGDFIEQYPRIHGRTGTVDAVEEPLDAAGGSSLPDRPGKTREISRRIACNCRPPADRHRRYGAERLRLALKEASRKHTGEVFDFVVRNKKVMPRTALRYAIELMPKELKAEAMKKE